MTDVTSPPAQAAASRPQSLAANLGALATSQAITWTATLLWTVVVPRALGPADMGVLVTALAVTAILGVLLGLPTRDFLTREMVARGPGVAPSLAGSALVLRLLLAPVCFAVTSVFVAVSTPGPTGTAVLYLCAGSTVLALLAEPALAAFQAAERMRYLAVYDVLTKTLQSVGGIVLALVGFRVVGIAGFNALVALAVVALVLVLLTRQVGVDLSAGLRAGWGLVRRSTAYWTFGVFYMVYLWVDTVLLGLLVPETVVGWYAVATKLFTTLMFVPAIVGTTWLPRLVRAFESGPPALIAAARAPLEIVALASLPVCAATAVGAHAVIPLLYGQSYAAAAPVLALLAFCFPLMYLNVIQYHVLVAAQRPRPWVRLMAAATVVNPACNLVLIPLTQHRLGNGAIGAAASLLVTELVIVSVGMRIVGHEILTRDLLGRVGRGLLAAGAMAAVMHLLLPRGLLLALLAAGVTLAVAVRLLHVVRPEHLGTARAAAVRGGRRLVRVVTRGPRSEAEDGAERTWRGGNGV